MYCIQKYSFRVNGHQISRHKICMMFSKQIVLNSKPSIFVENIVMQYCPVANYHYMYITYGGVFGGTPNLLMFWIYFLKMEAYSERTVNGALIPVVHTTLIFCFFLLPCTKTIQWLKPSLLANIGLCMCFTCI